jgi:NADH-quinone oxidoreductase subunit M
MPYPLLFLVLLPALGFLAVALIPSTRLTAIRWTALAAALAAFAFSLWIALALFRPLGDLQLVTDLRWAPAIRLALGVDGLSLMMVLLTTLLTPVAILSTWESVQERVKGFMLFFLLLEAALLGVFLAVDLVLFFVFWELTLIPMYFLIGLWGGERRVYAALKFFIFTMAGSVLMLLAILFIGIQAGTFYLPELLADRAAFAPTNSGSSAAPWLFLAFGLAFAVKVPLWPLHTWLPDAHVEAPTAGSVILAGLLLKMGVYGFIRFNLALFPEVALRAAPWLALLAVVGILYGAFVSYAQRDLKKLVAYSSVSHLGFVMLGVFALNPQGLTGAILQSVNHGLSTGALFLIVGFLYDRFHTRELAAFGGLWKSLPLLAPLALIVTLSSAGLPGLNGFTGEFTILLGAFGSQAIARLGLPAYWFAGTAALGVILAAVYLLAMFEKVFLGPRAGGAAPHAEPAVGAQKVEPAAPPGTTPLRPSAAAPPADLSLRELLVLLPLLLLIFWIGLYPAPFFRLIDPTVQQLVAHLQAAALALR